MTLSGVYLLHYEEPMNGAQHYLGASRDVFARIRHHEAGNGARFPAAFRRAGINFELARLWIATVAENPFHMERRLKRGKNNRKLCPTCQEDYAVKEMMVLMRNWLDVEDEPVQLPIKWEAAGTIEHGVVTMYERR